ncbi:MAG: hypothetical protein MHM6MM_000204 [Cercozoa sp. M6MM]
MWDSPWDQLEPSLQRRPLALAARAALKKRGADLPQLRQDDAWLCDDWHLQVAQRDYITKEELSRAMRWKLQRGTFRPRLQTLVDSSSESEVKEHSKAAFDAMSNFGDKSDKEQEKQIRSAIQSLSKLKGVGAATATLILCFALGGLHSEDTESASVGSHVPFMSDEAMQACAPLSPNEPKKRVQYTLAHAIRFFRACRQRSRQLNTTSAKLAEALFCATYAPAETPKNRSLKGAVSSASGAVPRRLVRKKSKAGSR